MLEDLSVGLASSKSCGFKVPRSLSWYMCDLHCFPCCMLCVMSPQLSSFNQVSSCYKSVNGHKTLPHGGNRSTPARVERSALLCAKPAWRIDLTLEINLSHEDKLFPEGLVLRLTPKASSAAPGSDFAGGRQGV